jgi:hypothetical protein
VKARKMMALSEARHVWYDPSTVPDSESAKPGGS